MSKFRIVTAAIHAAAAAADAAAAAAAAAEMMRFMQSNPGRVLRRRLLTGYQICASFDSNASRSPDESRIPDCPNSVQYTTDGFKLRTHRVECRRKSRKPGTRKRRI